MTLALNLNGGCAYQYSAPSVSVSLTSYVNTADYNNSATWVFSTRVISTYTSTVLSNGSTSNGGASASLYIVLPAVVAGMIVIVVIFLVLRRRFHSVKRGAQPAPTVAAAAPITSNPLFGLRHAHPTLASFISESVADGLSGRTWGNEPSLELDDEKVHVTDAFDDFGGMDPTGHSGYALAQEGGHPSQTLIPGDLDGSAAYSMANTRRVVLVPDTYDFKSAVDTSSLNASDTTYASPNATGPGALPVYALPAKRAPPPTSDS
jgi:hypothetical protein